MNRLVILPVLAALGGCSPVTPVPGTPEYAAAQVSRGFDCGLRPNRERILKGLSLDEQRRFYRANALYAVRSYNAPRSCGAFERNRVSSELSGLVGR